MRNKVVGYVRVSLARQVDGFSIEAQEEGIKRFADRREYELKEIYYDKGISGKEISKREGFQQMLNDLKYTDDVKYVLVFKLSRFGRNATDTLNSLSYLQEHNVELYAIQDNVASDTTTGKLMITLLGTLAEMERDNILTQSMAGRKRKAELGGWNGGFAPYGYELEQTERGKMPVVIESRARQI